MVVFLNFAPIQFMGGVERRILDIANLIIEKENVKIICVTPQIANIYAKLILKREFVDHLPKKKPQIFKNIVYISFASFIPLTKEWRSVREILKIGRVVYMKYELNELLLLLYFGNFSVLKKSVAALRTSLIYPAPKTKVEKIHNYIYGSRINKYFLNKFHKVHVLNIRDYNFVKAFVKKNKIYLITNSIELVSGRLLTRKANELNIAFVGELSYKKGVDVLLSVIRESPKNYKFHIAGDGYMKEDVLLAAKVCKNLKYHGYLDRKELFNLYRRSDVFLFPSRAETFGTVMIEAASQGCMILNSKLISLSLPANIEKSVQENSFKNYLKMLIQINEESINKNDIQRFIVKNFSVNEINAQLLRKVFAI